MDRRFLIGIAALVVVVVIAQRRDGRLWFGPGPEPEVMAIEESDPEMNAAINEARKTNGVFIEALSNPTPSRSHLSVKVAIQDAKGTEHFWLDNVSFRDQAFHGSIANTPGTVKSVRFGQRVKVNKNEISDWMLIEDGLLVGGYTTRVMRSRLSPEERSQLEANIGFKFE